MEFADIHSHVLYGIDDGANSIEEMHKLIDYEYAQGVRWLCCTPHFHPGYYGYNSLKRDEIFGELEEYVKYRYPDLNLFLGNELHYFRGCMEYVRNKDCLTINNTRYLLVDFDFDEDLHMIETSITDILREGYIPVFAHVERYKCLHRNYQCIKWLHDSGVIIQVNASSILRKKYYWFIRYLLRHYLVDVIASDTHNITTRFPALFDAHQFIAKKYGEKYAEQLFRITPKKIIKNSF